MQALDVYFPRNRDLAHVLALLAPPPSPDGAPPTPEPAAGLLLTAPPGTGLTSFLRDQFMASSHVRRRASELVSPESLGLEGDPRADALILEIAEEAATVEGPVILVVDQLQLIAPASQAELVEVLTRGAQTHPDLQYLVALGGEPSPELAAAMEGRPRLARIELPPLGEAYTRDLALYLADYSGLIIDPAAIDAVFKATGFRPGRLKAVIRELVHTGHPDIGTAAAALGIEVPEAV